jgi:hypothetical protein
MDIINLSLSDAHFMYLMKVGAKVYSSHVIVKKYHIDFFHIKLINTIISELNMLVTVIQNGSEHVAWTKHNRYCSM